jgi:hypothetical protein
MSALDRLVPTPRLCEVSHVDIAAPPERVWNAVRHGDLGNLPVVRALFALRTRSTDTMLRIDQLVSTPERPGFSLLVDEPSRTFAVGAIGQVWKLEIPFVYVANADAFARFADPHQVKVAWAIDVAPLEDGRSRVTFEVRVDATDDATWKKFRAYFAIIGPASRLIRVLLLHALARELESAERIRQRFPLPGDELMFAKEEVTDSIDIVAPPEAIWPWLVQMGCRRGGFYSYDFLDNGGEPSAREIHPEWQALRVGDVLPATPDDAGGFEVLRIDPGRALVLGGLVDGESNAGLPFSAPSPARFWRATWAFVLVPVDAFSTRLFVRARVSFARESLHLAWIRPVHHFMEAAQLRHLKERAEGRLPRDTMRDVASGVAGAAIMAASFLTSFLCDERSHWGLEREDADRPRAGDELVASPRWQWTHAVEIERSCAEVWPWVAQIGADRAGFYSYQWLENIAGCELRNAEAIHPEWAAAEGGALLLHPKMPPLRIVSAIPERGLVAYAPPDDAARAAGKAWASVSWAFLLEPLGPGRCRLVSRYRCATSDHLAMRLSLGPTFVEPVGFAMDRRMLLGIKERAEGESGSTGCAAPSPR